MGYHVHDADDNIELAHQSDGCPQDNEGNQDYKSDPHLQIARKIQFVERAKIALLDQLADVFRSIQSGGEREMAETLGQLVSIVYALGALLDVPLTAIDRVAESGVPSVLTGDFNSSEEMEFVLRHLKAKR
ncbi:MAG: hypothetical protein M0Z85_11580 [Gammaproteobacteria bacterium]|nr:hypothetical protein [Gammaproteobacteria bacterium]